MNIQRINNINIYKCQTNFGQSLSEQLGLDAQVRASVDSYIPEIKQEIRELVKAEMRATKSSISSEIDTKIDTYDKFNRIKTAVQESKRTGNRQQLARSLDAILSEQPINLNSRISTLNQLRSNPYKRKEFVENSI